jgi:hypothetical protein
VKRAQHALARAKYRKRMIVVAVAACSHPPPAPPGLAEIVVEPAEVAIETSAAGAEPIQFTASAIDENGGEFPLDVVEWSLSNRSAGTLDENGLFTPATTNGGITWVTAQLGDVSGEATVTEVYVEEQVLDGVDPAAFGGTADPTQGLWLYPEDGVNIPRNTPSLAFQWNDLGADGGYRLHFHSAVTDLSVYTTQLGWTADAVTWPKIVSTNAGGDVDIDLTASVGGALVTQPLTVHVNRMDATGEVYYWSTSAQGIRQIPYGGQGSDFLTPTQTGHCVACHSVSPQGLIAATLDGGDGPLIVKRISDLSDVIALEAGQYANFTTFSPDGRFVLGAFRGSLLLWSAETGALLWEVPVDGYATHPDWAPDDSAIAFTVMSDGSHADYSFPDSDAHVAVMDHYGDGTFGGQRDVAQPHEGIAYYPSWSPDSEWIAYDVSTGDGYDDGDASVWVVARDGGRPIKLGNANRPAGVDPSVELTNSWPRWAPLPDDDVLWLTFGSRRAYGRVTAGIPQIWVAGFDPERARDGDDPSWPAFWLPGQDPAQGNHIPVWSR